MDLLESAEVKNLDPTSRRKLAKLLAKYEEAIDREQGQKSFLGFIERVWPGFIHGNHHKIMADAFERVANGKLKRLIINMPPRHTKSEFASVHLPAWYLGRYPDRKVIQTSHTAELAVGFGRKVRDLLVDPKFQAIFPDVNLKADSKAAGRWNTNHKGEYYAIGVGGAVTGKGADLFIVDDPHSEQEAALAEFNPEIYDKVYEWYTSGPRQRLQPGGAIVIVMTRWGQRDLTAQVLRAQMEREGSDKWEVIELPAILQNPERSIWPEFWPLEELKSIQAELPLPKWMAQYQQNPTSDVAALIKRDWWQRWEKPDPPQCDIVIASIDTAFGKTERSHYTACTTWGVFRKEKDGESLQNLILLDAWKDKLSFPALKAKAKDHFDEYEPDIMLVEKKSAGEPLMYELRAMGIPVQEYTPVRGNDKISRVNSITDIFSSGLVWAPDKRWAEEVIEECASFPAGANDDFVDTVSQALIRFRKGGMVATTKDYKWKQDVKRKKRTYY